jgi:hypothetical protein
MGILESKICGQNAPKRTKSHIDFKTNSGGATPGPPSAGAPPPDQQEGEGREGKGQEEGKRRGREGDKVKGKKNGGDGRRQGKRGRGREEGSEKGRKRKGQRRRQTLHPLLKTKVGAYERVYVDRRWKHSLLSVSTCGRTQQSSRRPWFPSFLV